MNEFLEEFDWDYFVTLNFNFRSSVSEGRAREILKGLFARLDRTLLGRFWSKREDQRTFALVFPENVQTNLHFHALVRVDRVPQPTAMDFENALTSAWKGRVKSGTVDVQPVYDKGGAIRYSIKQLLREGHFERFFISTEFHSTNSEEKGLMKIL